MKREVVVPPIGLGLVNDCSDLYRAAFASCSLASAPCVITLSAHCPLFISQGQVEPPLRCSWSHPKPCCRRPRSSTWGRFPDPDVSHESDSGDFFPGALESRPSWAKLRAPGHEEEVQIYKGSGFCTKKSYGLIDLEFLDETTRKPP